MVTEFMALMASLTLDPKKYEEGLNKAERDAESKGKGIGSKLAGAGKLAAKGFAVAGTAVATAVGAMTKSAVSGYADLEQLEGGIETLFGESAPAVIKNANDAFKTAGMNANEYMETSIQSAAAMINSLGGDQKKAAEMMNMSITDMADNVNKMGTNMESVQDAYRGFSRGNFTMLDNLALGFAGTKEGMQQLLDKAEEISGVKYDISSYSDIVQAIHEVQTEMGITGTTAKEASETISGSIASFKSAWSNLITGFADDQADLDQLISNVVDTAGTVLENIIPVAEKAIDGIATFLEKAAPILAEKLPELVDNLLPRIFEAGNSLLTAIVETLPQIALTIITGLADSLVEIMPELIPAAIQGVATFAQGIAEALPELYGSAVSIIMMVVDGIIENIDMIIDAAISIMSGLAQGLIDNLPRVVAKIPEIVSKIVVAIITNLPKIIEATIQIGTAVIQALAEINWLQVGIDIIRGIVQGIFASGPAIKDALVSMAKAAWNSIISFWWIGSPSKLMRDKVGKNIGLGMALGIEDSENDVISAMDALNNQLAVPEFDTSVVGYADEPMEETMVDVLNMPDGYQGAGRTDAEPRDITVILQLDRTQLARTVFRLNNEETQRVGLNLAGGAAI